MNFTLSEAFTYLLSVHKRNFYARIISALTRIEKPGMGTMGVGISPEGKYLLYYDPEFVEKIPLQELVLTCQHEVFHLLLGHIPRFLDLLSGLRSEREKQKFHSVMNLATDCAVNEVMRSEQRFEERFGRWFNATEETEGRCFLTPEMFKLQRNQPYEVYQFQLLKDLEKSAQALADKLGIDQKSAEDILSTFFSQNPGNTHEGWTEGVGKDIQSEELQGLSDKLRQEGRRVIQKAVEEQQKSRGTIPGAMQDLIADLLTQPTIPWPQVLRSLCMRTRQTKLARGISRPNRRLYGVPDILPFPGKARDNRFTIAFALDTSGSMSTTELKMGLEEIVNIVTTEQDVSLVVMYCDADLHVTYDVDNVSDIDLNVTGRGGTDFNPPFKKVRELLTTDRAPDVLVYATDGYAPEPEPENRVPIPVIWLLTPNGREPSPDYGIHLRMEPQ